MPESSKSEELRLREAELAEREEKLRQRLLFWGYATVRSR